VALAPALEPTPAEVKKFRSSMMMPAKLLKSWLWEAFYVGYAMNCEKEVRLNVNDG
jgi:hypothetical protein